MSAPSESGQADHSTLAGPFTSRYGCWTLESVPVAAACPPRFAGWYVVPPFCDNQYRYGDALPRPNGRPRSCWNEAQSSSSFQHKTTASFHHRTVWRVSSIKSSSVHSSSSSMFTVYVEV